MPKALKATTENLDYIIAYASTLQFNLEFIQYDIDEYQSFGWDTYVITDGSAERNNVTFTLMGSSDFNRIWHFPTEELPSEFVTIEKI